MRKLRVHTIQFLKSEQAYGYGHAERVKSRVITETFLFETCRFDNIKHND